MRITRIQVIQLERSLHDRLANMSHGCVYAADHGSQSPWARASERARTRFAWQPRAPGVARFHTHVTLPHPWLSLAPTTSRSRARARASTRARAGAGKPSALGAQFTISKPSAPAATKASRSSQ